LALDSLGAMYLAYDLLGGEHGPLRTLTRAVTYGVIFGIGYGLPFGIIFGLCAAVTHGLTLGIEFSRTAKRRDSSLGAEALFSFIRAAGVGAGAAYLYGYRFGVAFCLLSTLGQIVAYRRGVRPGMDYNPQLRPQMSRRQIVAAVVRTLGYTVAGVLSSLFAHERSQAFAVGVRVGLAVGVASALTNFVSPYVEWWAEHLPEKRMGVYGVILILLGFAVGSLTYWVQLFDIPVH
jgi:hypothetical protein